MSSSVAPGAFAILSPANRASYSASLLVVGYYSRTACLMVSPSGDFKTTPIPPESFVDDPSMFTVHLDVCSTSSVGSSSFEVNSAMKSARA